jgi:hypothetical protein
MGVSAAFQAPVLVTLGASGSLTVQDVRVPVWVPIAYGHSGPRLAVGCARLSHAGPEDSCGSATVSGDQIGKQALNETKSWVAERPKSARLALRGLAGGSS